MRFGVVEPSGRPQATSVQLYTGSSPNGWIDTKYGLYKLLSPEVSRLVNSWVGTNVSEEGNLPNTLYQAQNKDSQSVLESLKPKSRYTMLYLQSCSVRDQGRPSSVSLSEISTSVLFLTLTQFLVTQFQTYAINAT